MWHKILLFIFVDWLQNVVNREQKRKLIELDQKGLYYILRQKTVIKADKTIVILCLCITYSFQLFYYIEVPHLQIPKRCWKKKQQNEDI